MPFAIYQTANCRQTGAYALRRVICLSRVTFKPCRDVSPIGYNAVYGIILTMPWRGRNR